MRVLYKETAFGEPVSRRKAKEEKTEEQASASNPVAMVLEIPKTFEMGVGCDQLTKIAGLNCHIHPGSTFNFLLMLAANRDELFAGMRKLIVAGVDARVADETLTVYFCDIDAPAPMPLNIIEACLYLSEKIAANGCSAHLIQGFTYTDGDPLVAVISNSGVGEDRIAESIRLIDPDIDMTKVQPNWVGTRVTSLQYNKPVQGA